MLTSQYSTSEISFGFFLNRVNITSQYIKKVNFKIFYLLSLSDKTQKTSHTKHNTVEPLITDTLINGHLQ
jgi:hypothetical protein